MASPTYRCNALVLKKTKLGESDLILTCLKDDGSQLRAVAKGARKPTNPFATRLDLFCIDEVLLAKGRNLDVVSEARLIDAHMQLRMEVDRSAAALPVLECLERTSQEDLEVPRAFDMAQAVLQHLSNTQPAHAPAFTAAFLLKLFTMLGLQPNLRTCVSCGSAVDTSHADCDVDFSYLDGGLLCRQCAPQHESVRVSAATIEWAFALMMATFDEIEQLDAGPDVSFAVLHLCHRWLREHMGMNLKSMNYLLTCGLF